jgi:hypothetical protein
VARLRRRQHGHSVALPALTAGFSTAAETEVRMGAGVNQVQYNINAPVSIDGGSGFDKVVVLGTEFADHIVVTATAIYGAGLSVSYANIEVLEIDGLEGDDIFDVLSTPARVNTRIIGGLGSDVITVAGDVTGPVYARDVEGHVRRGQPPGHRPRRRRVRRPGRRRRRRQHRPARSGQRHHQGVRRSTKVSEQAGPGLVRVDSYTVELAYRPTTTVYVTVSAAGASANESKLGGDTILVSTNDADSSAGTATTTWQGPSRSASRSAPSSSSSPRTATALRRSTSSPWTTRWPRATAR